MTALFRCLHFTLLARKTVIYFSATPLIQRQNISLNRAITMANFKFSYVRCFEKDDKLPPQQWIVISLENLPNNLSELYIKSANNRDNYTKLITTASLSVMDQFKDIKAAYIHFNKIHFVLPKDATVYQRRSYKLLTYLCSCLTSSFVMSWPEHFSEDLQELPMFDGCIHLFPNDQLLRDHLTMHQLAHHRVNLKQTLHLAIQEHKLKISCIPSTNICDSSCKEIDKDNTTAVPTTLMEVDDRESESYYNEVLFSDFDINYNNEPDVYKKGCILLRGRVSEESAAGASRSISKVLVKSVDFKQKSFWLESSLLDEQTCSNTKSTGLQKFAVGEWLLLHSWIVIRVDGKAFHKFSKDHCFDKPNDLRAINLMNVAAAEVMKKMPDIIFAFGESDEYSFVMNRYSKQAVRYSTSLVAQCVSLFTSAYVDNWPKAFDSDKPLQYGPMFDGRVVLYPTNTSLRDYLSWRQADCHINNMYNTVFWKLIQLKNITNKESEQILRGTLSADKRRIMLSLGIDYDLEPAIHRKGSILYRIPEGDTIPKDSILTSTKTVIEKTKSGNNTNENYEKPWWNSECEEIKLQRKNVRKKCQMQPSVQNFEELKVCEELAKKVFKSAKQNFHRQSNESVPALPMIIASFTQNDHSDLSHGKGLGGSKEVKQSARNKSLVDFYSNILHEEGVSSATKVENSRDPLPKGFDKRGNPWWSVECHLAKVARSAAKNAFMKNPDASTDKHFKDCEANLKTAIKAAKKEYKRLADPTKQNSCDQNQRPVNLHETCGVILDYSTTNIEEENMADVERMNTFCNKPKVEEMFASTLREGLSMTPAMPSDVHSEFYDFADSFPRQVLRCDDTSKGFGAQQTDDFGEFIDAVGSNLTDRSGLQTNTELAMGIIAASDCGSMRRDDLVPDRTCVVPISADAAPTLENVTGTDSGYNTSVLTETSRECNGKAAPIFSNVDYANCGGCGEYKKMGGNICLCHVDIIDADFWKRNPHILGKEKSTLSFDEDL